MVRSVTPRGKAETDRRLARIEGQVRGLRSMVADDRAAPELLTLVSSIRAALEGVTVTVLSLHVDDCLRRVAKGEDATEALTDAREAIARCRG